MYQYRSILKLSIYKECEDITDRSILLLFERLLSYTTLFGSFHVGTHLPMNVTLKGKRYSQTEIKIYFGSSVYIVSPWGFWLFVLIWSKTTKKKNQRAAEQSTARLISWMVISPQTENCCLQFIYSLRWQHSLNIVDERERAKDAQVN